jgi:hypothetical protein
MHKRVRIALDALVPHQTLKLGRWFDTADLKHFAFAGNRQGTSILGDLIQ